MLVHATYKHIDFRLKDSFRIQRFDEKNPCEHKGLHMHQGYEIVYVKNGRGSIKVEDIEIRYTDGVLLFIGPSIPHFGFSNTNNPDNFEIVIHLNQDFVTDRISMFPEFTGILKLIESSKKVLVFNNQSKKDHADLFDKITRLGKTEQLITIFGLLLSLSKVGTHQILLGRNLGEHYARSKQIKKVFDYINDNFQNQISTKDIAKEIGLTTNSFCRMFKNLTKKSFIAYLNNYRIHRATMLLEETDDNISKIMYECGFENPSYFAKVYTQIKNSQPAEYRKKYRRLNFSEKV